MINFRYVISMLFLLGAIFTLIIGDASNNPVDTVRLYSALILSTIYYIGADL